jgi:hypothetical protein
LFRVLHILHAPPVSLPKYFPQEMYLLR